MNRALISNLRLRNHQLLDSDFVQADKLVEWMGAVQAQDLQMSLLGIALRINQPARKTVEEALNNGEILRTHLMRPTWHIVSREDIYWMLDLTAPALKRLSAPKNNQLELSDEIFHKSYRILEKELQHGELSRDRIAEILQNNNIRTNENRLAHILGMAEYEQIVTSGTIKGNKQNYDLLANRVPVKKTLSREESILKLTERYFKSHGPATIADFAWWSFLSVKEIRWAMEELKNKFSTIAMDTEKFFFSPEILVAEPNKDSIHLLPAFDEFLVSYKSKHICVSDKNRLKAASVNGIFYPIIVKNGEIIGTWKYGTGKNKGKVEKNFFEITDAEIPSQKTDFILSHKF